MNEENEVNQGNQANQGRKQVDYHDDYHHRKRAYSSVMSCRMKQRSKLALSWIFLCLSRFSSRFLMKFFSLMPIIKQSTSTHSSSSRVTPCPQQFSTSSIFFRLLPWLNRITSKITCRTVNLAFSNRILASCSEIERTSASSCSSRTSCLTCLSASMALSTFSISTRLYSSRLALISWLVRNFMPPFYSIKGSRMMSSKSCFLLFSDQKASWESSSQFLNSSRSKGSMTKMEDSLQLSKTSCFVTASASGWRMAAKGGNLPLPIFLKSSIMTLVPSLLIILIISWTSAVV